MLIWSQEAFISALSLSLAHSLWQGALVGAGAVALHSRLQRATADVRYAACSLLLLTLVIAWLGSLACLYAAETHATAPPAATVPPVAAAPFPALPTLSAAASDPLSSHLQPRTLRSFAPSLVLLWTLGVSLLSLRHLSSLLALRRLQRVGTMPCPPEWQARIKSLALRMGLRREVLVRLSTRVDVPLTFGVLKSYLLLPPSTLLGLSTEQLEALIAHELAHIRQHDSLVNLLQIYAETLLFYHPVVWWLSAQMRVAREQRCDDLAVRIVGDHALYARALLTMEELRAPIPRLALGATGGNSHMSNHHLIQRIQRVLGAHGPEKRAPWMAGALALCTASIGLATLWPVHAHSAPTPTAPHRTLAKPTDEQQTGTTNKPRWSIGLGTGVNGKSIGLKFDSNTQDLTPDYPITVDGQPKRFGDLRDDEQQVIRMCVASARKDADKRFGDSSADTPEPPVALKGQPGQKDGQQTVTTNQPTWSVGLGTSVNGKSIGLKFDSNTQALPPDYPITVDGQQKRFGDMSADEQAQINKIVADTQQRYADGLKSDAKTRALPPDYPITVDGQPKRFGDMSADEQAQINMIVATTRKRYPESSVGLGTSVNGKSIGLTIDPNTPDPASEPPGTVNGQSNFQKQANAALTTSKHVFISKITGSKQSSTAGNEQRRTATAVNQKVHQLKVGNGQVKVFGDTLKPDTIVIINGVRSRFKDFSAARQKQIRAAWSHDHQWPHP